MKRIHIYTSTEDLENARKAAIYLGLVSKNGRPSSSAAMRAGVAVLANIADGIPADEAIKQIIGTVGR